MLVYAYVDNSYDDKNDASWFAVYRNSNEALGLTPWWTADFIELSSLVVVPDNGNSQQAIEMIKKAKDDKR